MMSPDVFDYADVLCRLQHSLTLTEGLEAAALNKFYVFNIYCIYIYMFVKTLSNVWIRISSQSIWVPKKVTSHCIISQGSLPRDMVLGI